MMTSWNILECRMMSWNILDRMMTSWNVPEHSWKVPKAVWEVVAIKGENIPKIVMTPDTFQLNVLIESSEIDLVIFSPISNSFVDSSFQISKYSFDSCPVYLGVS